MKRLVWMCFLLVAGTAAQGQGWSFGAEVVQLHAPGLDEMVRTYNFSRPGLARPQPLMGTGWGLNVRRVLGGTGNLKSGIALNYNRFGSRWESQGVVNQLGFHLLDLSYVAHLSGLSDLGEAWLELELGALGTLMQKQVEGPGIVEEEQGRGLGIGGKVSLLAGYRFSVSDDLALSPILKFGCVPFLHAPQNEVLINQTQDLLEDASTFQLTFSAGIRLSI